MITNQCLNIDLKIFYQIYCFFLLFNRFFSIFGSLNYHYIQPLYLYRRLNKIKPLDEIFSKNDKVNNGSSITFDISILRTKIINKNDRECFDL